MSIFDLIIGFASVLTIVLVLAAYAYSEYQRSKLEVHVDEPIDVKYNYTQLEQEPSYEKVIFQS